MLRITDILRAALTPDRAPARRPPAQRRPGPVVIWNLTRRCNLTCRHCYALSVDKDFPGELTTAEIGRVMDDLAAFRVPVLILSGGEPLLHPDILSISRQAKEMGFYVALSTNGTLIDTGLARKLARIDYDYIGISLDGIGATHDRFRRIDGGYDLALRGLRLCRDAGLPVGVRTTLTEDTAPDLPRLLDLVAAEQFPKFYLSHLNYAGRGNHNRAEDAFRRTTRTAVKTVFARAAADILSGAPHSYVSGNNDADGVFLYRWLAAHHPDAAPRAATALRRWGGNASGINVANIDNLGEVHPDTMWWQHSLGNIRDRRFGDIWTDLSDPLLAGLKSRPRPVTGRCGGCAHLDICNGNTRTRAYQLTGDPWAEDPACYLTDDEIGLTGGGPRLEPRPFGAGKRPAAIGEVM